MDTRMIKGWDFSDAEIDQALTENKMLMLDTETSNICNLSCAYCYRDEYAIGHRILDYELNLGERKRLIDEAKELGCKTVKIVGAGEPLIDTFFWDQVNYIHKKGMTPIVFTNGIILTKDKIKQLDRWGASIILKYNSNIPETEDKMVGRKGYAQRKNEVFKMLTDAGLNKTTPTRLGIDTVITKWNFGEILTLFEMCRSNNIFPMIKSFIPLGGALGLKDWEIEREDLVNLFKKAQKLDQKKFSINSTGELPYIGGFPCKQWHFALFVNILGEVYACPGTRRLLGNIKNKSLIEIWNDKMAASFRKTPYTSCPPREEHWRLAKTLKKDKTVEKTDECIQGAP